MNRHFKKYKNECKSETQMNDGKDPDDTTASVYGDMVRRMKALKNWWSYKNVGEFVHEAIREKLTQEQRLQSWRDEAPSEDGPPPQG